MSEGTAVDRAEKEWRQDAARDQRNGERSNGRGRSSSETAVVRKLGDGERKNEKIKKTHCCCFCGGRSCLGIGESQTAGSQDVSSKINKILFLQISVKNKVSNKKSQFFL